MDLPITGREGSKFGEFKKVSLMEIMICKTGAKK
jgi:hypothetical protein